MNAKPFILTGLCGVALCFATSNNLGARGIVVGPAPTNQPGIESDTNAPPAEPQPPPDHQPRFGEPGDEGPIVPGQPSPNHDKGSPSAGVPADQTQTPMPVNRASRLIGMTVKNPKNETLGRIKEVVIDLRTSRAPYVVMVKSGSNHGTGDQLAVPLSHFTPSSDQKTLVLNAERAQIEYASGFSGDNLPAMNNPVFGGQPEAPRREIIIIPVPVHPKPGQNQNPEQNLNPEQNQNPDQNRNGPQHDIVPQHLHKGPAVENP